jgi:HSP90 family molecular chaperone
MYEKYLEQNFKLYKLTKMYSNFLKMHIFIKNSEKTEKEKENTRRKQKKPKKSHPIVKPII